jgi:hypothetical protein
MRVLPVLLLCGFGSEDELFESLLLGRRRSFEAGKAYVIKERKPVRGFQHFVALVKGGYAGLFITRQHPDHVKREEDDWDARVIWLSTTLGHNYVDPHNLGNLTNIVSAHLEEHQKSVVLLDGLEYLMINNDFPRILKFIEYIHEIVMQRSAVFLISLDDRAFEDRELALLERNVEIVE